MGGHGRPCEVMGGHGRPWEVMQGHERPREAIGDHGSPWEVDMRDRYDQAGILRVETIGGHGRWSYEEDTLFLSFSRWRP
jgi:hypothetical protein